MINAIRIKNPQLADQPFGFSSWYREKTPHWRHNFSWPTEMPLPLQRDPHRVQIFATSSASSTDLGFASSSDLRFIY